MTEESKRLCIEYTSMFNEMRDFEEKGVNLYLEGQKSEPGKIAKAVVVNDSGCEYGRSFFKDSNGHDCLNFEKIEH